MKNLTLVILATALLASCTWVKATPEAVQVRILYHNQVEQCKRIGQATVSVLDSIAFIPRSAQQVSEELETLARNSAAEIHGDSAVAISKVIDGEQVFNIYRCKEK